MPFVNVCVNGLYLNRHYLHDTKKVWIILGAFFHVFKTNDKKYVFLSFRVIIYRLDYKKIFNVGLLCTFKLLQKYLKNVIVRCCWLSSIILVLYFF